MCGPGVIHHMLRKCQWTLLAQSCSLHCKSGVFFQPQTLEHELKFMLKFFSDINSTPHVHVSNKTKTPMVLNCVSSERKERRRGRGKEGGRDEKRKGER